MLNLNGMIDSSSSSSSSSSTSSRGGSFYFQRFIFLVCMKMVAFRVTMFLMMRYTDAASKQQPRCSAVSLNIEHRAGGRFQLAVLYHSITSKFETRSVLGDSFDACLAASALQ